MSRSYMLNSIRMAAFLSLNIQVERGGQRQLFTWPLCSLTGWIMWGWIAYVALRRWYFDGRRWLFSRLDIGLALGQIGLKSLLYGAGLSV